MHGPRHCSALTQRADPSRREEREASEWSWVKKPVCLFFSFAGVCDFHLKNKAVLSVDGESLHDITGRLWTALHWKGGCNRAAYWTVDPLAMSSQLHLFIHGITPILLSSFRNVQWSWKKSGCAGLIMGWTV